MSASDCEEEIDHESARRDCSEDESEGDPVRKTFQQILAKKLAERAKKKP
jgi:hypothetical protein